MRLPEASLDSPYKTTALVMAALLRFKANPEGCFSMLDVLRGPEPIKLRKKPSTNQWFLNDIQCLSDIRLPASADPWA